MDFSQVTVLTRDTIVMIMLLSLPLLSVAMIVGLIVNIIQTITSVQEQTISYVVKFLAIFITLIFLSNWMINKLTTFSISLLSRIPDFIK